MNTQAILPFINPGTCEKFGEVPMATPADVARAHQEMRQNLLWRKRRPLNESVSSKNCKRT